MNHSLYPRFSEPRVVEALEDSPVVLIHGPRQCGKTTLAQTVGNAREYAYFSFDDDVLLAAARSDPAGFVAGLPDQTILDEVQRVPELFSALKTTVDRRRTPGRFLITGSSNLLLVPTLSDSLAGRMDIVRLRPLGQCELNRREPDFLRHLFGSSFKARKTERLGDDLAKIIVSGGFPAALKRGTERRQATWYRNYIETLVQKDVRELTRIRSLEVLPRLLTFAAEQTARLINISDMASPFQVSRTTIRDYVTLLDRVFLLEELPSWHTNRLSRLVKTPKLHVGDTGIACSLLGLNSDALIRDRTLLGQLMETFVYLELRREASFLDHMIRFHHFRDRDGFEVDIVLESGDGRLAGVEVKAAATVKVSDFRGLKKLKQVAGKRFTTGVVLYDGETSAGFGDGLYAVPIRSLWEGV